MEVVLDDNKAGVEDKPQALLEVLTFTPRHSMARLALVSHGGRDLG